eukprot:TRINITY_DN25688_c0_g1_i1.p1 TRINITY_DN25688_c0_g1~~TRINITY_DN25688_c0_g1_i1.p1  ORF type:complete len:460 (+),score=55.48 TRINITY_DN25688_c0_g1_i1:32-1381(+)
MTTKDDIMKKTADKLRSLMRGDILVSPTQLPELFNSLREKVESKVAFIEISVLLENIGMALMAGLPEPDILQKIRPTDPITTLMKVIKRFGAKEKVKMEHQPMVEGAIMVIGQFVEDAPETMSPAGYMKMMRHIDVIFSYIASRVGKYDKFSLDWVCRTLHVFLRLSRTPEVQEKLVNAGAVRFLLRAAKDDPVLAMAGIGGLSGKAHKEIIAAKLHLTALDRLKLRPDADPYEQAEVVEFLTYLSEAAGPALKPYALDTRGLEFLFRKPFYPQYSLLESETTNLLFQIWSRDENAFANAFAKHPQAIYKHMVAMIRGGRLNRHLFNIAVMALDRNFGDPSPFSTVEVYDELVDIVTKKPQSALVLPILALMTRITQLFPLQVREHLKKHDKWKRHVLHLVSSAESEVADAARQLRDKIEAVESLPNGDVPSELLAEIRGKYAEFRPFL